MVKYEPDTLERLLHTFQRMHHRCIQTEFIKRGLKEASHPMILLALKFETNNLAASQKEIAHLVGISPPTVALSLKRMEKAGLVRKITDMSDMRKNLVTLTEKGTRLVEECETVFREIDRSIFNGFSDEEKEQMKQFYMRMIFNLESMGVQPPAQMKRGDECD